MRTWRLLPLAAILLGCAGGAAPAVDRTTPGRAPAPDNRGDKGTLPNGPPRNGTRVGECVLAAVSLEGARRGPADHAWARCGSPGRSSGPRGRKAPTSPARCSGA